MTVAGLIEALVLRLGQVPPGQGATLVLATLLFLGLPDADQLVRRLLHHRSILTHSVLPGLVVLRWGEELGPAAAAGAFLGLAVHLAADALSPARGFGLVWWPAPVRRSLGRWSRPWLLLNAVAAVALAAGALPPGPAWAILVGIAGGVAALGYGLGNERSIVSALTALGVVALGLGLHRWLQP